MNKMQFVMQVVAKIGRDFIEFNGACKNQFPSFSEFHKSLLLIVQIFQIQFHRLLLSTS